MSVALSFNLQTAAGASPIDVPISSLVIAGWTGRDEQALEKHIRELEDLGVARPKSTPIFYRVASSLLTTRDEIEVAGTDSSGEVEFVLYSTGQGLLVGLGSELLRSLIAYDRLDGVPHEVGGGVDNQHLGRVLGRHRPDGGALKLEGQKSAAVFQVGFGVPRA